MSSDRKERLVKTIDRLSQNIGKRPTRKKLVEPNVLGGEFTVARHEARGEKQSRQYDFDNLCSDFFVPGLYASGGRDSLVFMDVAIFRLSKRDKRAGEVIHYQLSDGFVEVKAGPDGMASIWDYDIVLMMASHLTESMNRYREGRGEKPGKTFRPRVSDILKFARRGSGTRQINEIEPALDRLRGTTIKTVRRKGAFRVAEAEGLIARYSVVSRTRSGRISSVEIGVPEWLYREVVENSNPDVLAVSSDYFLIKGGIERFIYRLARRAAGRGRAGNAKWSFQLLYERSGSEGTYAKFCFGLRGLIRTATLPDYKLEEEAGLSGPQLIMTYRGSVSSNS